jgi:hypothetical protein
MPLVDDFHHQTAGKSALTVHSENPSLVRIEKTGAPNTSPRARDWWHTMPSLRERYNLRSLRCKSTKIKRGSPQENFATMLAN